MKRRAMEVVGVVAVLAAVAVLLQLASVPAGGQEPEAAPPTPWGEPDLQGIWTTDYDTPLERPARYADREFFTDEERAAIDAERTRLLDTHRSERGSEQDVGGAYDASIFLTHKHLGRRTSLIIDPSDGQLPPVAADLQQRRTSRTSSRLPCCSPRTPAGPSGPAALRPARGRHCTTRRRRTTSRAP